MKPRRQASADSTMSMSQDASQIKPGKLTKDEVLQRLADALRTERKKVDLLMREFREASQDVRANSSFFLSFRIVIADYGCFIPQIDRLASKFEHMKRQSQDEKSKHIQIIAGLKRDLEVAHAELERAGEIEVNDTERYLDLISGTGSRSRASHMSSEAGVAAASVLSAAPVSSKYREEGFHVDPVVNEEEVASIIAIKARERQSERAKRLESNLELYEAEARANRVPGSSTPADMFEGPMKVGMSSDSETDPRPRRLSRRKFGFGSRRRASGGSRFESRSDTELSQPASGPTRPRYEFGVATQGHSSDTTTKKASPLLPPGARGQSRSADGPYGRGAGGGPEPEKRERKLSAGAFAHALYKGWKAL
jgi:hypothetical protein